MTRQAELREKVAELLRWQLDGDMDENVDERIPHPAWCNKDNCAKYNEQCRYCVTDQILKLIEGGDND